MLPAIKQSFFACLLCLSGCELVPQLWPEKALVDSNDAGIGAAPNCASCHAYPPDEGSHRHHLFSKDLMEKMSQKPGLNGLMTCMDCHQSAIAHFSVDGKSFRPLPYSNVDTARGAALAAEIDVLIRSYLKKNEMVPWRTSRKHFDRHLDIEFAENDVVAGHSTTASFNPKNLTCSAIACHESLSDAYRWND